MKNEGCTNHYYVSEKDTETERNTTKKAEKLGF